MRTLLTNGLDQVTEVGLLCLAVAHLTAPADQMLGVGKRWTMFLYMEVEAKKTHIDIAYLRRLERSINKELQYYGHPPVHLADAWRRIEL